MEKITRGFPVTKSKVVIFGKTETGEIVDTAQEILSCSEKELDEKVKSIRESYAEEKTKVIIEVETIESAIEKYEMPTSDFRRLGTKVIEKVKSTDGQTIAD